MGRRGLRGREEGWVVSECLGSSVRMEGSTVSLDGRSALRDCSAVERGAEVEGRVLGDCCTFVVGFGGDIDWR